MKNAKILAGTILLIVAAIVTVSLTGCTGHKTEATEPQADSTELVTDSVNVTVDSVAVEPQADTVTVKLAE